MEMLGGWSVYSYFLLVGSTFELTIMTRHADAKGYMHVGVVESSIEGWR